MADAPIPPVPMPVPPAPAPEGWRPLVVRLATILVTALLAALGGYLLPPAKVRIKTEQVVIPAAAESPDGYTQTFGWEKDDGAIVVNTNPVLTTQFKDTPAGKAALGDDDVFLWELMRKVTNRGPPFYPNVNQQSVGCCVGCAFKHAIDLLLAAQIAFGQQAEWKPVSVEAIYALSRNEIGGGRISGDGSVGRWAADAVKLYGVISMEKHGSVDFSEFSPSRARSLGRTGLPKELEDLAKKNPVKNTALVTSWADVKRANQQLYPVTVCSDQGFTMVRDRDGFARPQGTWMHAMCIIGVRGGPRPGAFILNSWGDQAHTGPTWPADAPVAGFWVDAATVDRMVRQGDSFALSDATGFPARKLDLRIQANPVNDRGMVTFRESLQIPFTNLSLRTQRVVTRGEWAAIEDHAHRRNAWALAP